MSHVKGLRCRECGAEIAHRPAARLRDLLRPARGAVRLRRHPARAHARAHRAPAAQPLALSRAAARSRASRTSACTRASRRSSGPIASAAVLGVKELWVKDDSVNHPTFSYKDRVVSVAISKAIEFGFDTVSCASTGNLANSVSAHAARAGLNCFIFIPDDLEQGKVIGSTIYGPRAVADPRQLRRRESAVQRDRRQVRLGLRQHQRAPVLHRGREDLRLRDRRAARLEAAAAHRRADRRRNDPAEGREGVPRAPRPRASSTATSRSTGAQAARLRAGGPGAPQAHRPDQPREAERRSPSRSPSATRPTATTC